MEIEAEALAADAAALRARRAAQRARLDAEDLSRRRQTARRDIHAEYRRAIASDPSQSSIHAESRRVALEALDKSHDADVQKLRPLWEGLDDERLVHIYSAKSSWRLHAELYRLASSPEGLAPWDVRVLDVLRQRGRLPSATPACGPTLKGAAAVELMQEALGISRSLFYDRFRPLLRVHYLSETEFAVLDNGGLGISRPRSGKRLRRDEVEALIRFVTMGSVIGGRAATSPGTDV